METKDNPLSAMSLQTGMGGAQPYNVDKDAHIRVYFANAWAFAAIRAIAKSVSSVPLRVQERSFKDGQEIWTTTEDNALAQILKRPNPDEPIEFLINRLIVSLLGTGDAYLYAPNGEGELYILQPSWVKVVTDKIGRRLGYQVEKLGMTSNEDTEEIIHFRSVNPTGEYYGMPPSHVITKTITTKISLDNYINNYFANNAMLGTTFSTDGPLTPDQRDQMRQDINRLHKGANRSFRIAILESGLKVDQLSKGLKDLIPTEISKAIREEVLAVYEVPPVVVSNLDGATYSNADIQIKLFYKNAVVPMMRTIETFLDLQYTYQFGDNLRVWFDRNEVPELQEDMDAETTRLVLQVGRKPIITQNEARLKLGYEEVEGGDSLATPAPASGGLFGGAGDEDDDENVDSEAMMRRAMSSNDPKRIAWTDHYVKVTKRERELIAILKVYFDGQLKRLISNLDELNFGDKGRSLNQAALKSMLLKMQIAYDSKGAAEDTAEIFNVKRENALLRAMTASFFEDTIEVAGEQSIAEVGSSVSFNVNNPKVQESLNLFWNRFKDINDTTFKTIQNTLQMSYDEGFGLDKTAKALQEQFKTMSRARAKRIASTEMNGLVNSGHTLGYAEAGVEQKEWVSAFLSTSRQTHMDASGDVVDIDDNFFVGNSTMAFPSDPNGLAEDTINCYCRVLPVVESV